MTLHIGQVESSIEVEGEERQGGGHHGPMLPQPAERERIAMIQLRLLIDESRLAAFDFDD
jgi:hypothetical protein